MSTMFYDQNDLRPVRRLVWGRLFGHCVGKTREAAGRSVEEAARLAGMATSQWQPSRPVTFRIQPSCARWPMPLSWVTTRSPCWPCCAGMAGSNKPCLPPPRIFRGTGGTYSQSHMLTSREGGERNQESSSIRSQESERER